MSASTEYDIIVVGGGPAGATAAHDLALQGHSVLLLDRAGRIKPCGGAIPPRLIRDFEIPDHLLKARISNARMISPSGQVVQMPIDGGYVGMVDREEFDEWLRERAASGGAERRKGTFSKISRDPDGRSVVTYEARDDNGETRTERVRARFVIGADGALSAVGKQAVPGADRLRYVFAYHEIIEAPPAGEVEDYDPRSCDIYYRGKLSPDFYAWVFPHGPTASVGVGSAHKGFSLKDATSATRAAAGLSNARTLRREGAPIPMKPLKRWDNGRDVILAGDAAGVVAPASGEGIYYAMYTGRLVGEAVAEALRCGDARALAQARKRFMKAHGRVFWILSIMQWFWYSSDKRRESFVAICRDKDVQRLTWESYMNKELVRTKPVAHVRIFFKDLAHLVGFAKA